MFDIGFSELVVIGVVALIVIGPERLPRVARTAGHLLGRFQRYVAEVKSDINREMELAELKKLQTTVEDAARESSNGEDRCAGSGAGIAQRRDRAAQGRRRNPPQRRDCASRDPYGDGTAVEHRGTGCC